MKDLLKTLEIILNIVMGLCVVLFLGCSVYRAWDYKTHYDRYVGDSAPWYLGIQIYGLLTAIILVVLLVIKLGVRKKLKQS